MSEWEPATDAEAAMRDALRTDDQESYFRILAGVDLLLPVSADALAGLAPLGWGTWSTGGRTHVLAFTSPAALQACLADYTGSARRVAYGELADTWPNLEWWLAVNPGLPIEGYLPAWFVAQLSRGDLRLPTRGPARDGIKTTQSAQELQAAARAANAAATGQSGGPIPPEERRAPDDRVAAGPVSASSAGASGRGGATAVGPDEAAARGAGSAAPASGPVGPGGLPIRTPGAVLPSGLPSRVPASSLPEDGVGYGSFSGFAAGAGVHPAGSGGAGVHPAGPGGAGAEVGTVPAAYRPPAVPPVSGPPVSPVSGPSVSPVSGTPVPSSGAPAGVSPAAPPQDPRRPLPTRTPMAQTPSLPGHPAQPAAPARPETGDDSAAPPTGGQQALAGATRADPADYRDAPDRGYHPAQAADRSNPRAGDRGSPSAADRGGSSAVDHDSQSAADRGDQPAAAAKRGHDSDAAADRGPDPSAAAGGDQPAPTADRSHTADAAGEPGRAPDGSDKAAVDDRDQVGADDRDQVGADDRDKAGADDRDKAANDRDEAVAAADQSDQPTADQRPRGHGDQSAGALPRRPVTPPSERPASMAAAAQALASGRTAPAEVPARPAAPRPGLAPPVVPGAGGSERPPFGSTGSGRPGVAASSPPRGGTPVPADDDTDFAPANPVEHDLFDAADGGSTDAFLSTLLLAMVLLPVADSSRPGSSPGEPGFVFRTERVDGERFLVVFTSRDRLAERYAEPTRTVGVKFLDLIRNWPDPAWSFAVNPGTPIGATYPGAQIVALANWAAEAGLGADPEERDAKPAPLPQRVSDAAQHATIMQKTVPAEQVGYYLERGYDRVAGFVHRANEVEHLRTPADLFAALGLVHDGTPYTSDAEEAFVLRWPAYRPSLYRIPYGGQSEQALRAMDGWVIERPPFRGNGFAPGEGRDVVAEFKVDSVRLPHGAELWRMDADGGETMIAVFDCDAPMWRRVGAQ